MGIQEGIHGKAIPLKELKEAQYVCRIRGGYKEEKMLERLSGPALKGLVKKKYIGTLYYGRSMENVLEGNKPGRREINQEFVTGIQTGEESGQYQDIGSGNSEKRTDLKVHLEDRIDNTLDYLDV